MKNKIRTIFTILIVFFALISTASASTVYKQGVVKSTSTIRTEPNSGSAAVKSDTNGTIILYYPEAVEVVGESGSYYQIKFLYSGFTYTGYIPKSNITVTTYETHDEYEQNLINQGFPSDYASRLAILHAIHPNWSFTPSYTNKVQGGMDFYTAVNGEASVIARNLISGSNTSLRSTDDGAYQNGEWISLSGSGWYAASRQTIAYYMDPRNFLDESHIFMFENLAYNPSTQTADTVNKIIDGTFMSLNNPFACTDTSYLCSVGSHTFTDTFIASATDKGVSPVHLASRVKQEQGSGGSVLSLGNGYKDQYIGFYNFFNIGASGKTTDDVILNGLLYAYNRNWNNQYASIYEGSSLIASNYIKNGQSTVYYQKFNVITSGLYGNQYMQNVRAPYSESYTTYTSYYKSYDSQENWNSAVYDFLIPVYSNMGSSTTLDTSGNADATLSSLNVTSCRLNPSFQSSAYEYDCFATKDTESISISAAATNALAKVEYSERVELTSDTTIVEIKVIAANWNTAIYKINVKKIDTDGYTPLEILNGIGLKVNGNFASNIEVGSDISNIINSILNKYHFSEVKVTDTANNSITSGQVKTGQKITITNSGITSTFAVILYGDPSGDGLIDIRDLLVIQKHLVKSKTITEEYLTASDINKDGTVDIRDLLLEQKYLLNAYSISQG